MTNEEHIWPLPALKALSKSQDQAVLLFLLNLPLQIPDQILQNLLTRASKSNAIPLDAIAKLPYLSKPLLKKLIKVAIFPSSKALLTIANRKDLTQEHLLLLATQPSILVRMYLLDSHEKLPKTILHELIMSNHIPEESVYRADLIKIKERHSSLSITSPRISNSWYQTLKKEHLVEMLFDRPDFDAQMAASLYGQLSHYKNLRRLLLAYMQTTLQWQQLSKPFAFKNLVPDRNETRINQAIVKKLQTTLPLVTAIS